MNLTLLLFVATAGCGLAMVAVGLAQARRTVPDAADYLRQLDSDGVEGDEFQSRLTLPFVVRVVRPLGSRVANAIAKLLPGNYMDSVHKKLLLAGMSNNVRAEELVTGQAVLIGFLTLSAIGVSVFLQPAPRIGILLLVLLPLVGVLLPQAWLNRKVAARKLAIFKDMPDVLDLLAISVEAGIGFEGALDVVCKHFNSPLAEEFSRTLKEMELGLPRRDALQNLKRRTEVPELSNFVLALTQADALGMPIGRVLRTQAAEMRSKRRQWAREKAAKLPVKILFPLVFFIFPAVLIVILGPAMPSMLTALE